MLFEECPNPHILDLVHRGWNRLTVLRDSTFSFVPGRARESVDEHERILRLIESGAEPLEIELAARRHRLATLDALHAYQERAHRQQHRTDHATNRRGRPPWPRTKQPPTTFPRTSRRRSSTSSTARFVDSVSGATFDVLDPVSNETYVHGGGRAEGGHRPRRRRRDARVPGGPVAADEAARARAHPEPDRRRGRGPGRAPRRTRDVRHRPADHAGARPGAARGRELPVLRRPDRRADRRRVQGPRLPAELRQPQADRRRRADHAVEHAVHAGELEARAGARVRLHGRAEARRVHSAVGEPVGRDLPRRRRAGRRLQPRQRPRRGGRRRPGEASRCAAHLVHRREPHRAADLRQRRPVPQGPVHGARRQVPRRGLRGRRPGRGDRLDPVRCLLAERRALHGRVAHPGRAGGLRRVLRAVRRAGEEHRGRRPARPRHRGRRARASRALRQGDELRRARQDGGTPARRRRPSGRFRARQLRGADGVRRCRAGCADLPGGDLRTGRRHHPVRHRRRRPWSSPTASGTGSPRTSGPATSPARTRSRRTSRPGWCG